MAEPQKDPEVDSQFAASKRLAKEKGTAPGIDPVTGERAAITYRQLFNETGDETAAQTIFDQVKRAGGFGDVDNNQVLDIRGLSDARDAHKASADQGVDFRSGEQLDKYGIHSHRQAAQHQDNIVNAVGEALRLLERG